MRIWPRTPASFCTHKSSETHLNKGVTSVTLAEKEKPQAVAQLFMETSERAVMACSQVTLEKAELENNKRDHVSSPGGLQAGHEGPDL